MVQHCYPPDTLAPARTVDAAISRVIDRCLGTRVVQDPFAMERVRLPARMFGGGFRSRADLAPAAFLGSLCRVIPRMLDSIGHQGLNIPGFLPQLEPLLGAGSFDHGAEETRFSELLAADVPLAHQLRDTWQGLRSEIGEATGALGVSARSFGADVAN
eukprot:6163603-Karenia_brevis.AAC.1